MTCDCRRVDCMLWDGIYHSACHVGRGEGSKGDSGTKGVIHTPSLDKKLEAELKASVC